MSKKICSTVALGLVAAGAALAAPAASAAPVAELRLSQARPSPALTELTLRATCAEACTLRLTQLNVIPFSTRGGVEQLANAATGELSASRRLPARRTVTITVAVPREVQRAAATAAPRGIAFVGHLVTEVTPAGGGEPVELPRQFTVTTPGTPSPVPASPYVDAIALPRQTTRRTPSAPPRYSMTLTGVQTSSWSYDRTRTDGGCTVLDRGSGRQTLRFRSIRPKTVQQVWWRTGELELQQVGMSFSGIFMPIRIEAERDSSADKGAQGDCGGPVGGGGGDGQRECVRRGSAEITLMAGYLEKKPVFDVGSTVLNWREPSSVPDCPVEYAGAPTLRDPLDILSASTKPGEDLTRGGSPGKVIIVLRARDVTRLDGGSVTTNVRTTVTFRKLK
ncbi:hypothetical protein Q5424_27270 [Conexibacter sp. JD483]|uniref:hypothetical protein n=1 Tax=unclassified Conexibacter TaxID=2627773 RepID=UPI002719CFA5|nr:MULTISPECIES: hypothetical protein [unclassified Conexibacter]MDO8189529.1 hypothetical protein [Conexibacter sp. CPCC 205706]MDO8201761.1 hypothetical protein [Conexibacter sp. CPCC 205762]MDR9372831.1 hypothetical protein [Conexibacter sp. JD483]